MENTVNQRVKLLRNSLGLSQQEFASAINSTITSISRIENGLSTPRKSTLKFICEKFHVDQNWLINGFGEMIFSYPEKEVLIDNPWKEEAYKNLKEENSFLKDQIKLMKEMMQVLRPTANFHNDIATVGVFGNKNISNIVRAQF